jgi:hypothetical protein
MLGKVKDVWHFRTVQGAIRGDESTHALRVPTMLLTSDWVRDVSRRDKRYGTLVRVLRLSSAPCAIVSAAGAGPLDYTDIPVDYPVFSFFARGRDTFIPRGTPFAARAADLTASFAAGALESGKLASGILIEKN